MIYFSIATLTILTLAAIWLAVQRARGPKSPQQRLFEALHPRPDLRERRFASWSMERRQRYLDACFGTPQSLRKRP